MKLSTSSSKKRLILSSVVMLLLFLVVTQLTQAQSCPSGQNAFSETIVVSRDAQVVETEPNNNYGSTNGITIRSVGGFYWGFIQFDLSSVSGSAVNEAKLLIPRPGTVVPGRANIIISKSAHEFNENEITWNNKPGLAAGGASISVNMDPQDDTSLQIISVDVTSIVQSQVSEGENWVGYAFIPVTGNTAFISARESGKPIQLSVSGCK